MQEVKWTGCSPLFPCKFLFCKLTNNKDNLSKHVCTAPPPGGTSPNFDALWTLLFHTLVYLICLSNSEGYWTLQYLLTLLSSNHVNLKSVVCYSLMSKADRNQQIFHCSLRRALRWDKPSPDFSVPHCRWHLLHWCLSRVFSPRISPAREVEETEHTVQPLQESMLITDHHKF